MQIQTQKFKDEVKVIDLSPSCKNCDRLPICGVFRAIQPLMNQWDEKLRPFQSEELAKICKYYAGNC